MIKDDYFIIFKRLFFVFWFYPLTRLLFAMFNTEYFQGISVLDIGLAFIYGLRFDFSTVLIANAIFIIGSIIPLKIKPYQLLLKTIFVCSNVLFLGVNIVDVEFFKFNGKKLTVDILGIGGDIKAQFFQLIGYYWYLSLAVVILGGVLWKFYPRVQKRHPIEIKKVKWWINPLIGLMAIIITFVGIRGGLQMRSISPKEAFRFERYELGNLALNSAYALVRSLDRKGMQVVKYYKTDYEVMEKIKKFRNFSSVYPGHEKQNVILVIIESFSQEYINEGYAPFFKKLAKQGLYFSKNFSNGRRSIEALPSIFTGMPSLIGKPISQSQYQTNKFISLPKILKNRGYDLSFFHGGKTGTMDFDAYTRSIGIDKYFAKEDYPNQDHYDGNWGIFDHHFLNYMTDYIDALDKPFFSTIFTLSSHQPYTLPTGFHNQFPKGSLEIHESIGYVDRSLELFFERAKKSKWYENTLFIITADHTQKLSKPGFLNALGQYRVPLLFFHPTVDLSQINNKRVTQHADIMPSVLSFMGIKPEEKLLFGSSVFDQDAGRMINFIGERFYYFRDPYLVTKRDEDVQVYQFNEDLSKQEAVTNYGEGLLEELKLYIQYTQNGLIKNQLYSD